MFAHMLRFHKCSLFVLVFFSLPMPDARPCCDEAADGFQGTSCVCSFPFPRVYSNTLGCGASIWAKDELSSLVATIVTVTLSQLKSTIYLTQKETV